METPVITYAIIAFTALISFIGFKNADIIVVLSARIPFFSAGLLKI